MRVSETKFPNNEIFLKRDWYFSPFSRFLLFIHYRANQKSFNSDIYCTYPFIIIYQTSDTTMQTKCSAMPFQLIESKIYPNRTNLPVPGNSSFQRIYLNCSDHFYFYFFFFANEGSAVLLTSFDLAQCNGAPPYFVSRTSTCSGWNSNSVATQARL